MIRVVCGCGKALKISEKHAGKRFKCPSCARIVAIPNQVVQPPSSVRTAPGSQASPQISDTSPPLQTRIESDRDGSVQVNDALEVLRRESRLLKRAATLAVVLAVVATACSIAGFVNSSIRIADIRQARMVPSTPNGEPKDSLDLHSVRVRRLTLVDEQDQPRVLMYCTDGDTTCAFADDTGNPRFVLTLDKNTGRGRLLFAKATGETLLEMGVNETDAGFLTVSDKTDSAGISLGRREGHMGLKVTDAKNKSQLVIASGDKGTGLGITDKSGAIRLALSVEEEGSFALYDKSGRQAGEFSTAKGQAILHCESANKERAVLSISQNGMPFLALYSKSALATLAIPENDRKPFLRLSDGNGKVLHNVP